MADLKDKIKKKLTSQITGSEDDSDQEMAKSGLPPAARAGKAPRIASEEIFGGSSYYKDGSKIDRPSDDSVDLKIGSGGSVIGKMSNKAADNIDDAAEARARKQRIERMKNAVMK